MHELQYNFPKFVMLISPIMVKSFNNSFRLFPVSTYVTKLML